LNGKSVAQLKMLGQIFDIGVSGQKVEMVETLMEFGATPAASGSKNIKEAKAQKREKNARKAAKKEKTNAGAKKGSAGGKKKKSTGLPPGAEHVKPAKTARYFYAQSVAKAVKAANPDADKADLMATIKEQFKALATKDAKKWEGQAKKDDARYAAEIAALEEDEDDFDVDDFDSDAEEEERPKKKAKKSAPKKKKAAPADDDDSDDDEPLKVGFPSNQKIRKCVDAIVRAADHEVMTKKTVRREAAAELKVDLDGKKDFIAQVIQETMNAMDEE
jgi:hypothetical protein